MAGPKSYSPADFDNIPFWGILAAEPFSGIPTRCVLGRKQTNGHADKTPQHSQFRPVTSPVITRMTVGSPTTTTLPANAREHGEYIDACVRCRLGLPFSLKIRLSSWVQHVIKL